MLINTNELIIYKHFNRRNIFDSITWLINNYTNKSFTHDEMKTKLYNSLNLLVELAVSHGLEGNLWHNYLTYLIVNNENAFSRACEGEGTASGSIDKLVLNDFKILLQLFRFDFKLIDDELGTDSSGLLDDFIPPEHSNFVYDCSIRHQIKSLSTYLSSAGSQNDFYNIVTGFYKHFGVGKFGLHKAFRIKTDADSVEIVPIHSVETVNFKDLVGYELQKKELIVNTENFVKGLKANNVLLYGDSGTGKSSSIKAVLNEFYSSGLRMIEVYKHQFGYLSSIISQLQNRNYKFIIYMDDLSFEDYETEYKYLKAVIEGGLEERPDNVLLYATSNRRHLIREKWSDKDDRDDDLHTNDTVQEKLSLAARFGLSILYTSPNKKEYNHIVKTLAERHNIHIPEEELYLEANRWELRYGGMSGRTAQHFITYLLGKHRG